MKTISLTKGKVALVDAADFDWLLQWKWFANGDPLYAKAKIQMRHVKMQNLILTPPPGMLVDHEDRNSLNNQRYNLRICNALQNAANRWRTDNTSGFKGVFWETKKGKWRARLQLKNGKIHLGLFSNPVEAAKAYDAALIDQRGEFALTNQKMGLLP